MKTNIKQTAEYLKQLFGVEDKRNKSVLGKYDMEVIVHDKSTNINAASIEAKIKVLDNSDEGKILGEAWCSVLVIEKATVNQKSKDEFVRMCSVVMNNTTREIVWDKMSRDSVTYATEYCFGYMLNTVANIRGVKPKRNIKEYVKGVVEELGPADEEPTQEEVIPEATVSGEGQEVTE